MLLNNSDPKLDIPKGYFPDEFLLKDHQKTSLHRVVKLEQNEESREIHLGVFADHVGSGKTHVCLSLIIYEKINRHSINFAKTFNNLSRASNWLKDSSIAPEDISKDFINSTLIICPYGQVYKQWYETIKSTKNINAFCIKSLVDIEKFYETLGFNPIVTSQFRVKKKQNPILITKLKTIKQEATNLFEQYEQLFTSKYDFRGGSADEYDIEAYVQDIASWMNRKLSFKICESLLVETNYRYGVLFKELHNLIFVKFKTDIDKKVEQIKTLFNLDLDTKISQHQFRQNFQKIDQFDIVLICSSKVSDFVSKIDYIPCDESISKVFQKTRSSFLDYWKRLIIDEAHLDRYGNNFFYAQFIWLVSATDLTNHLNNNIKLKYFRNLFNVRQTVQDITVKNDINFVKANLNLPEFEEFKYILKAPSYIFALNGNISEELLGSINADNLGPIFARHQIQLDSYPEDLVIKHLTQNLQDEIKDIKNKIMKKQQELNDSVTDVKYDKSDKIDKSENISHSMSSLSLKESQKKTLSEIKDSINNSVERYQKLISQKNCQITSIQERIQQVKGGSCPICYEDFKYPIVLNCKHIFCASCVTAIFKTSQSNRCPECRQAISNQTLVFLRDHDDTVQHNPIQERTKTDVVKEILGSNPDGKFLIYSEHDESFRNVINYLKDQKVPHAYASGSSITQISNIKKFENGEIKILMLNAKTNGCGMNLQMTTDLIMYHKMKPEVEKQIIGRAHRQGRQNSLRVHKLSYLGEV